MIDKGSYVPPEGFADLRQYDLTPEEFHALAFAQRYLRRQEDVRLEGRCIHDFSRERDLSAQIQMELLGRERA